MGKSSVIYVIGLSLIVGLILMNVNRSSHQSMDAYMAYYGRTMSHNIAVAAANVAAQRLLGSPDSSSDFSGSFAGGAFTVRYDDVSTSKKRVTVVTNYNVGGETMGYTTGDEYARDTIVARFEYINFARYGWFTERESNGYRDTSGVTGPYYGASDWKITGDSVFGFAHTNDRFNLGGRPYFYETVTASRGPRLTTVNGEQDPIYNHGYDWSKTIPRDTANISALRSLTNAGSPIESLMVNRNVGMTFTDNTVRVLVPWNTGAVLDTTLPVASLSTTNVIGVINGDLHIKGRYEGRVTVAAFSGAGADSNRGNIWIDGNIIAKDNPAANPSSNDMLGIVAERMTYIGQDNTRNSSSVLDIQAAVYCHRGELTAWNFFTIGIHGRVNLFGGVTQNTAGSLGVFNSFGLIHGFFYSIRGDSRFGSQSPPHFPFSRQYRLASWWE